MTLRKANSLLQCLNNLLQQTSIANYLTCVLQILGAAEGLAAIFALHNWPYTPTGTIAACAGPIMSATRCFQARITGLGGHGGMPHTTVDPIVAVTATISALQAPLHLCS